MMQIDTAELRRSAVWILLGCVVLALLSGFGVWFDLDLASISMLYVIVVVLLSMQGNIAPAIILALIASATLNYFFTEPRFSWEIERPEDVISIVVFVL